MGVTAERTNWVRLKEYCQRKGESVNTVKARRLGSKEKDPEWIEGIHWKNIGRAVWVDLVAAEEWLNEA